MVRFVCMIISWAPVHFWRCTVKSCWKVQLNRLGVSKYENVFLLNGWMSCGCMFTYDNVLVHIWISVYWILHIQLWLCDSTREGELSIVLFIILWLTFLCQLCLAGSCLLISTSPDFWQPSSISQLSVDLTILGAMMAK